MLDDNYYRIEKCFIDSFTGETIAPGTLLYCKNGDTVIVKDIIDDEFILSFSGNTYKRSIKDSYHIVLFTKPYEINELYYDLYGFDQFGYNREGIDKFGYDKEGYNINGYDKEGYDKAGYNIDGFDREGYDRFGYDKDGYDRSGYRKDGTSKYKEIIEICKDCGKEYKLSPTEVKWFVDKGMRIPKRCKECRKKKSKYEGLEDAFRNEHEKRKTGRQMYYDAYGPYIEE